MKSRLSLIIASVVVVIAMAVTGTWVVGAQSASNSAAQGLQISPTRVELNAEKGKAYTINLTVTNVTLTDLIYVMSIEDFNSKDETGTPQILLDSVLPATASITTWTSAEPEFMLRSKQSRDITATLTIPTNAEPGGHYGVILFSGRPPELKSTGVALSASTGALILVRVDGDITEKADLTSFTTESGGSQTSFFENAPITFITRVKNTGNIHIKPTGNIELKDMFGNIVTSLPVNSDKSNVLPNSTRRFETIHDGWMFGRYTASLALGYGNTGQAITATISFWVIPYRLILAALVVGATIVFILTKLIKAYNRRIIAKAQNEKTNKKDAKKKHK